MLKVCKNKECNKEFDTWQSKRKFCCIKCAVIGKDYKSIGVKCSETLTTHYKNNPKLKNKTKVIKIKEVKIKTYKERSYNALSWEEKVKKRPFNELSFDYKRIFVFIEQKHTCKSCGLDKWLGGVIPLELDHIDGDTKNNSRENLQALCPNCHSLTITYCGRNKLKGKFPPDNVFYEKYKELGNIRKALLHFNVAAKGGNYDSARKIIQKREPFTSIQSSINTESLKRKDTI